MGDKNGWLSNLSSVDLRGPGVSRQYVNGSKGWKHGKASEVRVRFYKGCASPGTMMDGWTFADLRGQLKGFESHGPGSYGSADVLRGFLKRAGQAPKKRKAKAKAPKLDAPQLEPATKARPPGTTTILRKARKAAAAK